MNLFCKHEWKILSEKTTESKMEHFAKITNKYQPPSFMEQYNDMTTRKHICIVTCTKCGKLKRFVEEI